MKAEVMLARFLGAGGSVKWHTRTDKLASATFSHPQGGTITVEWTLEMARAAGLTGKDVWKSYPRAMLHARCVSEGVRAIFPAATGHVLAAEEAGDLPALNGQPVAGELAPPLREKNAAWQDDAVGYSPEESRAILADLQELLKDVTPEGLNDWWRKSKPVIEKLLPGDRELLRLACAEKRALAFPDLPRQRSEKQAEAE